MHPRAHFIASASALLLALAPARVLALPPIARSMVAPLEVEEGAEVTFSSAGSLDPDGDPLTFVWDFGDGASATGPNASHTYAATGSYDVVLSVSDGRSTARAVSTVTVTVPPSAGAATASSGIAIDRAARLLWAINHDSGSITEVDLDGRAALREVAVCERPVSVAASLDGGALLLACAGEDEVIRLDRGTLAVRDRVRAGVGVGALAIRPDDGAIVVSWSASHLVTVHEPDLTLRASVPVGDEPRAIAIDADGRRAYVTHFLTRGERGAVSIVDLSSNAVTTVALVEDEGPDSASSGRGFPNLLGAIAIEPSGRGVWIGGLKSNTSRGLLRSGEALVPHNRVRGVMLRLESSTGLEVPARRIDANNADRVSAIAFSQSSRWAYTAHPGIGAVSILDLVAASEHDRSDGSPVTPTSRIEVGAAPDALVLDGTTLWAHASLSRQLVAIDVSEPAAPVELARIDVTSEPLDPEVALGQRLFFASTAPTHSLDGYIACASCHPDGGHDGRTWDFTQSGEGLRNTIDLRGRRGMGHGPVHWSANFDEIQDFENDIVGAFGGAGLAGDGRPPHPSLIGPPNAGRSAALDALAAYLASLDRFAPSPHRAADGRLADAARRGRALFFDETLGCASCHAPPRFTDSTLTADPADYLLHDVGTLAPSSGGRLGGALTGLDTPTLLGLWDGAPYLHDGRASSLRDVLTVHNPEDEHGVTSHLSAAQLEELVAFLLSLEGRADELPDAASDAGVAYDGGVARDAGPDVGVTDAAGDADVSAAPSCACLAGRRPLPAPWALLLALSLVLHSRRHAP